MNSWSFCLYHQSADSTGMSPWQVYAALGLSPGLHASAAFKRHSSQCSQYRNLLVHCTIHFKFIYYLTLILIKHIHKWQNQFLSSYSFWLSSLSRLISREQGVNKSESTKTPQMCSTTEQLLSACSRIIRNRSNSFPEVRLTIFQPDVMVHASKSNTHHHSKVSLGGREWKAGEEGGEE